MTMTKHDVRLNLTRIGAILGVLGAFWLLVTAAGNLLDNRFVQQATYAKDKAEIGGKLDRILDVACDGREQTVRACQ